MAFAGGSADKVGNEYETWWTLRRVTQLLRGEIDAIALEPLGADGAELWVESDGIRTYDQVKYRSQGRWTPSRLRSDGILGKLGPHYAAGWRVQLVLSQPSEEFEQLIQFAQATSSATELWSTASNANNLDLLSDAWGVGKEETRDYLLRTQVRHDGLPYLKDFVELAIQMLVLGGGELAIGVLRRFLEDRVNTTFTAPEVWARLKEADLPPRPSIEPGPTVAQLSESLERYVQAVQRSLPEGGAITRHEVDAVVEAITNSSSAPIVLVAGSAGAGKSMVVADAASRLAASGRHVSAVRLDRVSPTTATAAQLGAAMDLNGSPSLLLSEVSASGSAGVLVIDQLDAVSSYSGRMPTVYDAVDEALRQARLVGNVKVIVAVRSIDLQEDPRLRKLVGEEVPTIDVGELETADVRVYLEQFGIDVATVDSRTLEVLRLPIYLYVFTQLDPTSRAVPYSTLTSLYEAYTRSFRARLELAGNGDHWATVSRILVERMNADEALAVPASALDAVPVTYVAALVSANVLIEQEGRIALFHETYFDHLFARSFTQRGQGLVDWFLASGQGLFRRSQLRQLLEHIATEEPRVFADQVVAIANSSLRPHLVAIAYTVLGAFHPTGADWLVIRPLLANTNPFSSRIISLVGSPLWFRAVDDTGDVENLLDDPEWNEFASVLVARLAADEPNRVLELLAHRTGKGELWVRAIRSAIEVSDSPAWAEFALKQFASETLDLPDQRFEILELPLFDRLVGPHPDVALRLLFEAVHRDIDTAIAESEPDLAESLTRRGGRWTEDQQIDKLASSIPAEFSETIAPLIEKIATYGPAERRSWRFHVRRAHRDFDDVLYFAFDAALTRLSSDEFGRARPILERFTDHRMESLDFLVCRALNSAPADYAVDWLLQSEDHRTVGWISGRRWESRRLIETASKECSDDRFASLEASVLFWTPSYIDAKTTLRMSGLAELDLLSALATSRLSTLALRRLGELHRKFPDWEPPEPESASGGFVQPPIDADAARRMSDSHWMDAIEQYRDRDRRSFRDGGAFGGRDELASLMGTLAKDSPVRYLRLALSLPSSAPAAYTEHVIRGLGGTVRQEELLPLLRKYREDYPAESGRAIVAAIDEYAREISDDFFDLLLEVSEDADPDREYARETTGSGFYFGGDLVSAGINSTRGQAAGVLARVIFADNDRLELAIPALVRLADDPIVAVKALAAEPALAYASVARAEGLDLIERILKDELVLATSTTLRALRWAMLWEAERFAPFLTRALALEDAKDAGSVWANCWVNASLGSASTDVSKLSDSARLGVADAISSNPGIALDLVSELLDDPTPEVRREAARSVRGIGELEVSARDMLMARFVDSAAFREDPQDLIDALENLAGELPPKTWDVCRRAIDLMEVSLPRRHGALGADLIAILVRLFRSSDSGGREMALDLIDRTVMLQLWRVEDALDKAR